MFPSNEEETIALFRLMQDRLGWRIVHQQTQFPDLIIENGDGAQLLAEAEHLAGNFKLHGHDSKGCDLIVCWQNNWPDAPLPIWTLEDFVAPVSRSVNALQKRVTFWIDENIELSRKVEELERENEKKQHDLEKSRQIISELKLEIEELRYTGFTTITFEYEGEDLTFFVPFSYPRWKI